MEEYYFRLNDLPADEQKLLKAARETMKNAYNIYSGFFVGAAVLTDDDSIFTGACMENASYGLTLCAEAGAIQSAFSAGKYGISKIAITGGSSPESEGEPVAPCGRCRQLIYEASQVSGKDIDVILANAAKNKILKTTISQLLPVPFGPKDLGFVDPLSLLKNRHL